MNLKQQLKEKKLFLRKAYEAAYDYAPSSPLLVSLEPREFGKSIGFDETQTERIMMELVGDGYVQSSLGMGMLLVTRLGLEYLREIEDEPHTATTEFKVTQNSDYILSKCILKENELRKIMHKLLENHQSLKCELLMIMKFHEIIYRPKGHSGGRLRLI